MAVSDEIRSLLEQPRESLAVELKPWLDLKNPQHQAKIIKTVIALRNNNGGYMILGFDDSLKPDGNPPADIVESYHPDKIQGLISKYSSESFEIGMEYPEKDGVKYPVLIVPGGVKNMVAAKADLKDEKGRQLIAAHDVYIRSLQSNNTPSSTKPTWRDWPNIGQILFDNREADIGNFLRRHLSGGALENLRTIFGPPEPPTTTHEENVRSFYEGVRPRFEEIRAEKGLQLPDHGFWEAALIINGPVPPQKSTREFLGQLGASNPRYTGWPVWLNSEGFSDPSSRPYFYRNGWEAFIVSLEGWSAHIDFQRFEPAGRFYLRRSLQDDIGADKHPEPFTQLDFGLAIIRVAETIAVGMAFAKAMGCDVEATNLSVIACASEDLPPGYTARRNVG
jgi:Putative DNA-binding domain